MRASIDNEVGHDDSNDFIQKYWLGDLKKIKPII